MRTTLKQDVMYHNLVKWLSHYLYFFSLLHKEYRKLSLDHSHIVTSHDECGKAVHRPCSSCISSIQKITETLLSSSCQLRLGVDLSCLG